MEIWDILDEKGSITGKTIIRGEELKEGEYHLVVHIWIQNDKGEYLIQKRADHLKLLPGKWAITGGSAVQGEDSITAAIREVKEELGLDVDINKMNKIVRIKRKDNLADVWMLKQNVSLEDLVLQEEEVSKAAWATKEDIMNMVRDGVFHDYGKDYFEQMFK